MKTMLSGQGRRLIPPVVMMCWLASLLPLWTQAFCTRSTRVVVVAFSTRAPPLPIPSFSRGIAAMGRTRSVHSTTGGIKSRTTDTTITTCGGGGTTVSSTRLYAFGELGAIFALAGESPAVAAVATSVLTAVTATWIHEHKDDAGAVAVGGGNGHHDENGDDNHHHHNNNDSNGILQTIQKKKAKELADMDPNEREVWKSYQRDHDSQYIHDNERLLAVCKLPLNIMLNTTELFPSSATEAMTATRSRAIEKPDVENVPSNHDETSKIKISSSNATVTVLAIEKENKTEPISSSVKDKKSMNPSVHEETKEQSHKATGAMKGVVGNPFPFLRHRKSSPIKTSIPPTAVASETPPPSPAVIDPALMDPFRMSTKTRSRNALLLTDDPMLSSTDPIDATATNTSSFTSKEVPSDTSSPVLSETAEQVLTTNSTVIKSTPDSKTLNNKETDMGKKRQLDDDYENTVAIFAIHESKMASRLLDSPVKIKAESSLPVAAEKKEIIQSPTSSSVLKAEQSVKRGVDTNVVAAAKDVVASSRVAHNSTTLAQSSLVEELEWYEQPHSVLPDHSTNGTILFVTSTKPSSAATAKRSLTPQPTTNSSTSATEPEGAKSRTTSAVPKRIDTTSATPVVSETTPKQQTQNATSVVSQKEATSQVESTQIPSPATSTATTDKKITVSSTDPSSPEFWRQFPSSTTRAKDDGKTIPANHEKPKDLSVPVENSHTPRKVDSTVVASASAKLDETKIAISEKSHDIPPKSVSTPSSAAAKDPVGGLPSATTAESSETTTGPEMTIPDEQEDDEDETIDDKSADYWWRNSGIPGETVIEDFIAPSKPSKKKSVPKAKATDKPSSSPVKKSVNDKPAPAPAQKSQPSSILSKDKITGAPVWWSESSRGSYEEAQEESGNEWWRSAGFSASLPTSESDEATTNPRSTFSSSSASSSTADTSEETVGASGNEWWRSGSFNAGSTTAAEGGPSTTAPGSSGSSTSNTASEDSYYYGKSSVPSWGIRESMNDPYSDDLGNEWWRGKTYGAESASKKKADPSMANRNAPGAFNANAPPIAWPTQPSGPFGPHNSPNPAAMYGDGRAYVPADIRGGMPSRPEGGVGREGYLQSFSGPPPSRQQSDPRMFGGTKANSFNHKPPVGWPPQPSTPFVPNTSRESPPMYGDSRGYNPSVSGVPPRNEAPFSGVDYSQSYSVQAPPPHQPDPGMFNVNTANTFNENPSAPWPPQPPKPFIPDTFPDPLAMYGDGHGYDPTFPPGGVPSRPDAAVGLNGVQQSWSGPPPTQQQDPRMFGANAARWAPQSSGPNTAPDLTTMYGGVPGYNPPAEAVPPRNEADFGNSRFPPGFENPVASGFPNNPPSAATGWQVGSMPPNISPRDAAVPPTVMNGPPAEYQPPRVVSSNFAPAYSSQGNVVYWPNFESTAGPRNKQAPKGPVRTQGVTSQPHLGTPDLVSSRSSGMDRRSTYNDRSNSRDEPREGRTSGAPEVPSFNNNNQLTEAIAGRAINDAHNLQDSPRERIDDERRYNLPFAEGFEIGSADHTSYSMEETNTHYVPAVEAKHPIKRSETESSQDGSSLSRETSDSPKSQDVDVNFDGNRFANNHYGASSDSASQRRDFRVSPKSFKEPSGSIPGNIYLKGVVERTDSSSQAFVSDQSPALSAPDRVTKNLGTRDSIMARTDAYNDVSTENRDQASSLPKPSFGPPNTFNPASGFIPGSSYNPSITESASDAPTRLSSKELRPLGQDNAWASNGIDVRSENRHATPATSPSPATKEQHRSYGPFKAFRQSSGVVPGSSYVPGMTGSSTVPNPPSVPFDARSSSIGGSLNKNGAFVPSNDASMDGPRVPSQSDSSRVLSSSQHIPVASVKVSGYGPPKTYNPSTGVVPGGFYAPNAAGGEIHTPTHRSNELHPIGQDNAWASNGIDVRSQNRQVKSASSPPTTAKEQRSSYGPSKTFKQSSGVVPGSSYVPGVAGSFSVQSQSSSPSTGGNTETFNKEDIFNGANDSRFDGQRVPSQSGSFGTGTPGSDSQKSSTAGLGLGAAEWQDGDRRVQQAAPDKRYRSDDPNLPTYNPTSVVNPNGSYLPNAWGPPNLSDPPADGLLFAIEPSTDDSSGSFAGRDNQHFSSSFSASSGKVRFASNGLPKVYKERAGSSSGNSNIPTNDGRDHKSGSSILSGVLDSTSSRNSTSSFPRSSPFSGENTGGRIHQSPEPVLATHGSPRSPFFRETHSNHTSSSFESTQSFQMNPSTSSATATLNPPENLAMESSSTESRPMGNQYKSSGSSTYGPVRSTGVYRGNYLDSLSGGRTDATSNNMLRP